MASHRVLRAGLHHARKTFLAAVGVVLGLALVTALTDNLGHRLCGRDGQGADLPGATLLFGCDR